MFIGHYFSGTSGTGSRENVHSFFQQSRDSGTIYIYDMIDDMYIYMYMYNIYIYYIQRTN